MSRMSEFRERIAPASSDPAIIRAQIGFGVLVLCILIWMVYWWVL
jgi:hypothetical protein